MGEEKNRKIILADMRPVKTNVKDLDAQLVSREQLPKKKAPI
jgi:hypothetical protein